MCAATDLCAILCVNCDNVRTVLYVTDCKIVYRDRSECDRVGNVYCVNCDNISRML